MRCFGAVTISSISSPTRTPSALKVERLQLPDALHSTTPEVAKESAQRLRQLTSKRDVIQGLVACRGTKVIIDSIQQLRTDEAHVALALRSLWNISFGEEDNRRHIVECQGIAVVLEAMGKYPSDGGIAQFGCVILFNLTVAKEAVGQCCTQCCKLKTPLPSFLW